MTVRFDYSEKREPEWNACLVEYTEREKPLVGLDELTEEERKKLESGINRRVTGWLEEFLKRNPGKREQVMECLRQGMDLSGKNI